MSRSILAGAMVLSAGHALAEEEKTYPRIEVTVGVEIENDLTTKSDDKSTKINDLYNTTEVATAIYFTNFLSIQSSTTFEPVLDPKPFKDRTFGDHGAYMDVLMVQFEQGPFTAVAGKFHPTFGTAWDVAPGIFGSGFAEDYEISERLGGSVAFKLESESGTHTFTASIYRADTSFLSGSAFTKRPRTYLSSGGPSNTKGLKSFTFTIDGEKIASLPGFTYHIGVSHQAKGQGDAKNEFGVVLGASQEIDLGNEQTLTLLGEGAHLTHAGATVDNAFYLTGSGEYKTGPWSASASHTWRQMIVKAGPNVNDHLSTVTAGYEIPDGPMAGVGLNIGYKHVREAMVKSDVIGFVISKEFSFSLPK